MSDGPSSGDRWSLSVDDPSRAPDRIASLERRNSELTAELEDLRQFKKEVDGEGVVPATRVLDKERQVSELTARIAELEERERVAIASWDEERLRALREGERVVELRAALAEARKDSAWQPIETAPKDGTQVVIWERDFKVPKIARYLLGDWRGSGYVYVATHWMPLPATPLPETEGNL